MWYRFAMKPNAAQKGNLSGAHQPWMEMEQAGLISTDARALVQQFKHGEGKVAWFTPPFRPGDGKSLPPQARSGQ